MRSWSTVEVVVVRPFIDIALGGNTDDRRTLRGDAQRRSRGCDRPSVVSSGTSSHCSDFTSERSTMYRHPKEVRKWLSPQRRLLLRRQ